MPMNKDNTEYQYLRLIDGKEIFALVREINITKLELNFPMNVMCKSAVSGGVSIHLGPFVPFTHQDRMIISERDVIVRTSITDQFIHLYDESIAAWSEMRDNGSIEIKSTKQDFEAQQVQLASLVKNRLSKVFHRDEMWEDYRDDEEDDFYEYQSLPDTEDIIH